MFGPVGNEAISPRLDDLEDDDREIFPQFVHADQDPDKLATAAMLIKACAVGIQAFEQLSDPLPRSWAAGWKKLVLYITALSTQIFGGQVRPES